MNIAIKSFLYLSFFLVSFAMQAQRCGMHTQDLLQLTQRLKSNKASLQNGLIEQRMEAQYIPIIFHLVAKDDDTQAVSEGDVLDQLCSLNQDFEVLDIQFYIKEFNYINSTTLFDEHSMGRTEMDNAQDPLGLDIFIFKNANNDTTIDDGVTFGYFSPNKDWLVMRKDQINDRSIVLTHEMGHFFSLLHPYNGWDSEPWDEAVHGSPAPFNSPTGVRTEFQNGSNCENAGDFLCDTPPDYFFAFGSQNCVYTGGALDPNGDEVDPDETNYMSNFLNGCDIEAYRFSPKQQELMQADLQTSQRAYLRTGFQPIATSITEEVRLISPEREETTKNYNLVSFTWEAVEGANQYLVEIDRLPTFAVQPTRMITASTAIEATGFLADQRYYWRVRPFNEYATCAPSSAPQVFRTGTSSDSLQLIENWNVFPNPVRTSNNLTIEIETNRSFDATLELFDSIGRLVSTSIKTISSAAKRYNIDTQRLSSGVYLLRMTVGEEHFQRKVVLLD